MTMTNNEFKEEVEDFVRLCCMNYLDRVTAEYDFTDADHPIATIKLEVNNCKTRQFDVSAERDEIVIDLYDSGTLPCDDAGLYMTLWNEAEYELFELQIKYDKLLEKSNKPIVCDGCKNIAEHYLCKECEK